jgi:hypothetical protein
MTQQRGVGALRSNRRVPAKSHAVGLSTNYKTTHAHPDNTAGGNHGHMCIEKAEWSDMSKFASQNVEEYSSRVAQAVRVGPLFGGTPYRIWERGNTVKKRVAL